MVNTESIAAVSLAALTLPALCGCAVAEHPTASIILVGDTAFGERYQERRGARGETNVLVERGYDYPLAEVAPLLEGANVVVANLESSLNTLDASPLEGRKEYVHQGDPARTTETLVRHGVGVVSLANNHAMDYGAGGLEQTMAALDDAGLIWIGAGPNQGRAARAFGFTLEVGERKFRVAIAAGFEVRRSYAENFDYYAGADRPGVNGWTPETAGAQIRALRAHEPDAFIIAYPHWGANYAWRNERQLELARALVDAGADLVIGHGAHTIQEIERYQNRWIIYNIGNFVFLSDGRYARTGAPPYGLVARVVIGYGRRPAIHVDLTPVRSNNLDTGFQPHGVERGALSSIRTLLIDHGSDGDLLADRLFIAGDGMRLTLGPDEHDSTWTSPSDD